MSKTQIMVSSIINPRVAINSFKLCLHTWSRSGSPYGMGTNLLLHAGMSIVGLASTDGEGLEEWHKKRNKYAGIASLASSVLLIGFSYLAPATLSSLALFIAVDTALRAVASNALGHSWDTNKSDYATTLGMNINQDGKLVKGLLDAVIYSSSLLALIHATPYALPIVVGAHVLKIAANGYDLCIARYKSERINNINQAVAEVFRIGVLAGFMALSPVPSFTMAALFFLADGFAKSIENACTEERCAMIPALV